MKKKDSFRDGTGFELILPQFRLIVACCLLTIIFGSELAMAQPPFSVLDPATLPKTDCEAIDAVIPSKAPATPKKRRRLLIYDVNAGCEGHESILYADYALRQMGHRTGAFEVVRSIDARDFRWDNLKTFDAICFNNVIGAPFEDDKLFKNITRFVTEGGGIMAIHGSTAAFLLWGKGGGKDVFPEFGQMIGARGVRHRGLNEKVHIKVDEPNHPLTKMFAQDGFDWTGEFLRFPDLYSRNDLRVLLSIDTVKTDLTRDTQYEKERNDNDYGIAWIRPFHKGRVFYCSLGHQKQVFFEPSLLAFYLAATQYVLGDYDIPDQPIKQ